MNLAEAVRDLTDALAAAEGSGRGAARMRAARQVVADRCIATLGIAVSGQSSLPTVIRLAASAANRPARRTCAALLVHALAVPGLVPTASFGDVCTLVEGGLHDVLLRCNYPFGGTTEARIRVLERLHRTLDELMQPLEPTFPNWQGLYAG